MTTPRRARRTALLVGALLLASRLPAQATGTLSGKVVDDRSDRPLPGVEVSIAALARSVVTDSLGEFVLRDIEIGQQSVQLRKIGYKPLSASVAITASETPEQTLRLVANATELGAVTTFATLRDRRLAAFEAHRGEKNGGTFLTAAMLEKEAGRPLADVLQSVRGVDIVRGNNGAAWFATRRGIDSFRYMPGATPGDRLRGASAGLCYAAVVLNSVFVYRGSDGEELFDLNTLQPDRILGIEVYRGGSTMPLEYNATRSTCGLLVIYTK